MLYQKIKPIYALTPFVECYFIWEWNAEAPVSVQSPPNCFCSIVVNYADLYFASQHNADRTQVPRAFVSGQFTSNYQLHLAGNIGMIGIVLRPSTLHNFFGIRMSELVNSRAPLSFLPGIEMDSLSAHISNVSTQDRIKIFEELLFRFLNTGKSNLTIIDEAIDRIDELKGCVTVESLATEMKVSRRYLEKKFLEKVGLSPKYYSRLKRFSTLSNVIAHSSEIDWQQIVMDYGFHDQSHLVKEFMEFNQMNPSRYHLLHREMTRFINT
jgi:AraC-like DNA-binding protein